MEEIIYPFMITKEGKIFNDKTKRYLKPQKNKNGYLKVRVNIEGKKMSFSIHREVAKAFIPNPENKPQVNHIDGNKGNNCVDNLEWCTNQENVNHAMRNGLWKNNLKASQESNEKRKKPVVGIGPNNEKKYFSSVSNAEKEFGRHVSDVLKGKREHTKKWFFFYA